METKILETKWGNIDYFYLKNIVYPNGLIVLNGTIVYKEWRGEYSEEDKETAGGGRRHDKNLV